MAEKNVFIDQLKGIVKDKKSALSFLKLRNLEFSKPR